MTSSVFRPENILLSEIRPKTMDEHWMYFALKEAIKAHGFTKPNPMVGAILVSENNELISSGFHEYFGQKHAEAIAIENAHNYDLSRATLYTTLEPCCHSNKKTPPCLPLILQKKIRRVVISTKDPNPQVSGNSIAILKSKGIDVTCNVLENQTRYLLRDYIFKKSFNRPYIHLKMALTLDGSFCIETCENKKPTWFTNSVAKNYVHFLRALADGICVGGNTFRIDAPKLTCRLESFANNPNFVQPKKYLLSKSNLECNTDSLTIIKTIENLLDIDSQLLLIEAGPRLSSLLLERNLVQEISVIMTPHLSGSGEKLSLKNSQNVNDILDSNKGTWHQCDDNIIYHWLSDV